MKSDNLEETINNSSLDQHQIYFLIRYAEILGYNKAIFRLRPGYPFRCVRQWIIYIGGWENPELYQIDCNKPAWEIFRNNTRYPSESIRNFCLRRLASIRDPFPIVLWGHFLTLFDKSVRIKLGSKSYLCLSNDSREHKIYWSPDGSPKHELAKIYWHRENSISLK